MLDRRAAEKPGKEGEWIHDCLSPPFILVVLPSPSGSGEAFLFGPRECFPLSEEEEAQTHTDSKRFVYVITHEKC